MRVSNDVACVAAQNLAQALGYTTDGMWRYFWYFVGSDYFEAFKNYHRATAEFNLPDDVVWKIKALAGTHYKTMAKIITLTTEIRPWSKADYDASTYSDADIQSSM